MAFQNKLDLIYHNFKYVKTNLESAILEISRFFEIKQALDLLVFK